MLKTFKKLYLNTYFRVPLKFVITLSISKFLHDLFQWYLLGKEIRIPRYVTLVIYLDGHLCKFKSTKSSISYSLSLQS